MKPRRRYVVRTRSAPPSRLHAATGSAAAGGAAGGAAVDIATQRELLAIREVVHAFLNAERPEEAFQFALDRVGPVVGASFASVYVLDGAAELMRLAAAWNWPEASRPWLAEMRVRVGFGPSGEAVGERRTIEVPDVFADDGLEDWQDVARELGFSAIVSVPLQRQRHASGAVTFYFASWDSFTPERRGLLKLVADVMAAAVHQAELLDRVRRLETAVADTHADLEREVARVADARAVQREFSELAASALAGLVGGAEEFVAHQTVEGLVMMAAAQSGTLQLAIDRFDPRVALREAMRQVAGRRTNGPLVADEPIHALPVLTTDREKLTALLARLIGRAAAGGGEQRVVLRASGPRVEFLVPGAPGVDFEWRVAAVLANALGATLAEASEAADADPRAVVLTIEGEVPRSSAAIPTVEENRS
ncbi:MAG: GAF domain-containing protein [Gemmatimonadetes bacterium]|nr:GAF domain-containing protein [Gemmatimonadota bacterium]